MIKKTSVSLFAVFLMYSACGNVIAFGNKPQEDISKKVASKQEQAKEGDIKANSSVKPASGMQQNITNGFADIAEAALPAVVNVATTQIIEIKDHLSEIFPSMPGLPEEVLRDFSEFFNSEKGATRRVQSLGSGFIIRSDEKEAIVVTNYHVIKSSKKISIFLHDKVELDATIFAYDERTDIALLKVKTDSLPKGKRKLATLEWESVAHKNRVGEWVLAIGNPFGLGSTVTNGIISNISRDVVTPNRQSYIDSFIQHSAQINMGNSGGCLLNMNGRVIGINSAIFSPSGGNVGIGFAIPADIAQKTIDQLLKHRRVKRGWLGVNIQNLTDEMGLSLKKGGLNGAIVIGVQDGPASKAGVKVGDVIIKFDGTPVDEFNNRLSRLVGETPVGKKCKLTVWRDNRELELDVVITEFDDAALQGKSDKEGSRGEKGANTTTEVLGISVVPITNDMKNRYGSQVENGVIVVRVDNNSPGIDVGLMRGDVITEVMFGGSYYKIETSKNFADFINKAKKERHRSVLLKIMRAGDPRFVPLRIDDDFEGKMEENTNLEQELDKAKGADNSAPFGVNKSDKGSGSEVIKDPKSSQDPKTSKSPQNSLQGDGTAQGQKDLKQAPIDHPANKPKLPPAA